MATAVARKKPGKRAGGQGKNNRGPQRGKIIEVGPRREPLKLFKSCLPIILELVKWLRSHFN